MNQPVVLCTNSVPDDVLTPVQGLAKVLQGPGGGYTIPRAEVLVLAPQLSAIVNQGELQSTRNCWTRRHNCASSPMWPPVTTTWIWS